MDINTAIDQLVRFKKIAKMLGDCNLVGFDNNSFTVKVSFSEQADNNDAAPVAERRPILGFAESTSKKKGKTKRSK